MFFRVAVHYRFGFVGKENRKQPKRHLHVPPQQYSHTLLSTDTFSYQPFNTTYPFHQPKALKTQTRQSHLVLTPRRFPTGRSNNETETDVDNNHTAFSAGGPHLSLSHTHTHIPLRISLRLKRPGLRPKWHSIRQCTTLDRGPMGQK